MLLLSNEAETLQNFLSPLILDIPGHEILYDALCCSDIMIKCFG